MKRHQEICVRVSGLLVVCCKTLLARQVVIGIKKEKEWRRQVLKFRMKYALHTLKRRMHQLIVKWRAKRIRFTSKRKRTRIIVRKQKSRPLSTKGSSRNSLQTEDLSALEIFHREEPQQNEIKDIIEQMGTYEADESDHELGSRFTPILGLSYESYRLPTLSSTRKYRVKHNQARFKDLFKLPSLKMRTVSLTPVSRRRKQWIC